LQHVCCHSTLLLQATSFPIAIGHIETITSLNTPNSDRVAVSGFALLPDINRPADGIVVIDPARSQETHTLTIVAIGKSGFSRSDLRQHWGPHYQYAGWYVEIAAPLDQAAQLQFFAFDATQNRFFRLKGKAHP